MKNILIYKQEDNLCVTHFVENLNPSQIAQEAENLVPFGTLYRIGTVDELPEDRVFREAWEVDDALLDRVSGMLKTKKMIEKLQNATISTAEQVKQASVSHRDTIARIKQKEKRMFFLKKSIPEHIIKDLKYIDSAIDPFPEIDEDNFSSLSISDIDEDGVSSLSISDIETDDSAISSLSMSDIMKDAEPELRDMVLEYDVLRVEALRDLVDAAMFEAEANEKKQALKTFNSKIKDFKQIYDNLKSKISNIHEDLILDKRRDDLIPSDLNTIDQYDDTISSLQLEREALFTEAESSDDLSSLQIIEND